MSCPLESSCHAKKEKAILYNKRSHVRANLQEDEVLSFVTQRDLELDLQKHNLEPGMNRSHSV